MDFVLTSLSSISEEALWHLHGTDNWSVSGGRFGGSTLIQINHAASQPLDQWVERETAVAICSSFEHDFSASDMVEKLLSGNHTGNYVSPNLTPCIVFDWTQQELWVYSDTVAAIPVWYAFQDQQYMVTTDLLIAYKSGFTEPTALGPSQVLHMSTAAMEILDIYDATLQYAPPYGDFTDIPEVYNRRLAMAAVEAVEAVVPNLPLSPTIEVDPLRSSGVFLNCVMDGMKANRTTRHTRPRVTDSLAAIEYADVLKILESIPAGFMRTAGTASREESFASIAIEQWRVCQAASATGGGVLLSYDTGLEPRPVEVYLQNLFCRRLNVTVRYPLRDATFQIALWSTRHPRSSFHEAVKVLRSPAPAQGLAAYVEDSNSAGQHPFCDVPGHGERRWSLEDLAPCRGAKCADERASYDATGARHTAAVGRSSAGVERRTQTDRTGTTSGMPNTLLRMHRAAKTHAAPDGTIILLLVTKGYADMLTNFLCAAHTAGVRNFLILTQDEEIRALARQFSVGYYTPPATGLDSQHLSDADFGTVTYQQLVFGRTELAMELLLLGFRPIIADVDTVWLSDPLRHLPWHGAINDNARADVAITDDNGEVCGCFIALRNTDNAVRFWRQVYIAHRQLIVDAMKTGNFLAFDESEQKVVTQLLYKGGYQSELYVIQLPPSLFPSGYTYFTLQSHRVQATVPAVVHNNYIVGQALKRARFRRYGLWSTLQSQPDGDTMVCVTDAVLDEWKRVFPEASRNTSIPSLNLYLPVHGSLVTDSDKVMVHVAAEGPVHIAMNRTRADYAFPQANVYVDKHPPSHMEASPAVFAVLHMAGLVNHSVLAFTVTTQREDAAINVDVGFHRSLLAIDRAGQSAQRAARTVQYNSLALTQSVAGTIPPTPRTLLPPYLTPPEYANKIDLGSKLEALSKDQAMQYSIRVITYNRPASLQRLLKSLAEADYRGRRDIDLHIVIDGARSPEEAEGVLQTQQVVESFLWHFGEKRIRRQPHNIGLARQWLEVWHPAENSHEAAFVFEDDIEVSPHFFTWATRAVEKYYGLDPAQRSLQDELLQAVRRHAHYNGGVQAERNLSHLAEYAEVTAGLPVLYGICLQRQHLDSNHYPRRLSIRNGHRPFLYSLIGSWGPLLLARPWRAFLEWQRWRADQPGGGTPPKTEHLVTNHFLSQNPRIWTPWFIRFAYETGSKCLYPNLLGGRALVVNHREAGENYVAAQGPDGILVAAAEGSEAAVDAGAGGAAGLVTEASALNKALWDFPPISTVATTQYDFNLRRPGALGADAAHSEVDGSDIQHIHEAMRLHRSYAAHHRLADTTQLSAEHWVYILDLVESNLLPGAHLLHISATPLLFVLPTVHNEFAQAWYMGASTAQAPLQWLRSVAGNSSSFLRYAIQHTSIMTHASDLRDSATDMIILDMTMLSADPEHIVQLYAVTSALSPAGYLLVLGACTAAPTDLSVEFLPQIDGTALQWYFMVEDVCSLGEEDVGAVLYRWKKASGLDGGHRFATSRRLQGGFQTRRVTHSGGLL